MSWLLSELARWRKANDRPYEYADPNVESSEMRESIGLQWFFSYGDEQLTQEELGEIIDDCLVEYISETLQHREEDMISSEDVKGVFLFLEERMKEDANLKAYALNLPAMTDSKVAKPASEILSSLAKRHAVYDGKPAVSRSEAHGLAFALLVRFRYGDWAKHDWNICAYKQFSAAVWRRERDHNELRTLVLQSQWSASAWDTLKQICEDASKGGMEEMVRLPFELLIWYFAKGHGYFPRPDLAPAPRGPRETHGTKLRNNEIRHSIYLLEQVGVPAPKARNAVAEAVGLSEGRIRYICRYPNWTLEDFRMDGERRSQSLNYVVLAKRLSMTHLSAFSRNCPQISSCLSLLLRFALIVSMPLYKARISCSIVIL